MLGYKTPHQQINSPIYHFDKTLSKKINIEKYPYLLYGYR